MWSVPKTAYQQIRTQLEIPRNINSASKSCYPSQTTKVSPDDRNLKIQSNHRCYKMQFPQKGQSTQGVQKPQVQASKYKRYAKTQA